MGYLVKCRKKEPQTNTRIFGLVKQFVLIEGEFRSLEFIEESK